MNHKRNKMMKNCIQLVIIALMVSGCSKLTDVLNMDPPNSLDQNNVVTTAEGARNIVKGIHAQLHNQYYYLYSELLPSVLTGTMGQGSTAVNTQFVINEVQPTLPDVRHVYQAFYRIVNQANWAIVQISALDSDVLPEPEKSQLIGQARGLRALGHFDVLRYYGQFYDPESSFGIVLRTEPADFTTRAKARGTVAEAYDLILKDLDYAIAHASPFQKPVLFSSTAAKALKARVLLYKGDYAAAAMLADEVIAENTRTLSPTFATVFSSGFASTEMIFMRATDAVTAAQNERKRFTYDNRAAIAGTFLLSLLADDPRQPATYAAANNAIVKVNNTDFHKPTYLIRLAELYLIKAEGLARSGASLDDAKEPLEVIMSRAWGEPRTAVATEQAELLDEIYTEIIKELCFENGSDWFASLRFGKISEVKPSVTRISQHILPIPEAEITANYLFGPQNPGY